MKIDDIVFAELELTEKERKEVYYVTAELVQQRLQKARRCEESLYISGEGINVKIC